jgi:hypothetical protein
MTTDEQRLRAALAAAAKSDGLNAPTYVERALLAQLRHRRLASLAGRAAIGGAIAAALLLGVMLTRPQPPPATQVTVVEKPAPVLAAEKAVAPAAPASRPARRRTRRTSVPPPVVTEQGEFIPVGPWQAIEPMERGSIIRVRLPKSSLPGFGIPVSPDRWHESIPADVVLGEDGSMRAVRFVSTRY